MNRLARILLAALVGLSLYSLTSTLELPTFFSLPIYRFELWLIFNHLENAFLGAMVAVVVGNSYLCYRGIGAMIKEGRA